MVAIVSGQGLGLSNTSASVLGNSGQFGAARIGKKNEAAYVNVFNGNLVVQGQDDFIAADGVNLALTRTYNAQGNRNEQDGYGAHWHSGLDKKVLGLVGELNSVGSSITRIDSDGSASVFRYDADKKAYISTDGGGAYQSLVNSNGKWLWRADRLNAQGVYETYNAAGLIATSADRNGTRLRYTYQDERLASVTNSNGDVTSFNYEGSNIASITTRFAQGNNQFFSQTRVSYQYEEDQTRLKSVTTDLTPLDATDNKTYTTYYRYEGTGTRLSDLWQDDGSLLHFTYDHAGRVETFTDALGNLTSYTYQHNATTVTQDGRSTTYRFDSAGQLTSVEEPSTAAGQAITRFEYDNAGNLTRTIDARGNMSFARYDANGNRNFEQDAAGNTIRRTYHSTSNVLLSETRYQKAATTVKVSGEPLTGESGAMKSYNVYDSATHLLRFQISAAGRVTEYTYNNLHQRISSRQFSAANFDVSKVEIPSNSALLTQLQEWRNSAAAEIAQSVLHTYTYNLHGGLASETAYSALDSKGDGLAEGSTVNIFTYDSNGQLAQKIDGNKNLTSYVYDGLGRLQSSTDGVVLRPDNSLDTSKQRQLLYAYNDQLTWEDSIPKSAESTMSVIGRAGGKELTTYDRLGRVASSIADSNDSNSGKLTYRYDPRGQLRAISNALGQTQYFLYDEASNKIADVDSDGSLVEYHYNLNDQISKTTRYATRIQSAELLANAIEQSQTGESLLAQLRQSHANDQSSWMVYDLAGRLTDTIESAGTVVISSNTIADAGYVTRREYDGASQLVRTTRYATAISVAHFKDSALASDYTVAPNTARDRSTRSFYDKDGLFIASLDAEGYVRSNHYNSAGQLVHTVAYANAYLPADQTAANSLARATWSTIETQLLGNQSGEDILQWQIFDAKNRLIASIDGEHYLTKIEYDAAGNVAQRTRFNERVNFDAADKLLTLSEVEIVLSANDQTTVYKYNSRNQLSMESFAEGAATPFSTRYLYDAFGQLSTVLRGYQESEEQGQITLEQRGQRMRYDSQGRLTDELSAEGANLLRISEVTGKSYSSAELAEIWNNYARHYTYNSAGQRINVREPVQGNSKDNTQTRDSFYFYNAQGQLTYSINAMGEVLETRYNALHQVESSVQYEGRIASSWLRLEHYQSGTLLAEIGKLANAAKDRVESVEYDKLGRVFRQTDALGQSTVTSYNSFNEVNNTKRFNANSSVGGIVLNRYEYDKRGNLTTTTPHNNQSMAVTMKYDAFGRVEKTIKDNGKVRTVDFDRLGRIEIEIGEYNPYDAEQLPTRHLRYDAFNRVVEEYNALDQGSSYTYDPVLHAITMTTREGVVHTTTKNNFGETVSINDGAGNTTIYEYDQSGRVTSVRDQFGVRSQQKYDEFGAGLLIESRDARDVVTHYQYDAVKRVFKQTLEPNGLQLVTEYEYDTASRVVRVTDPRGVVTKTIYDKIGQVDVIIVDEGEGPDHLNLITRFEYDSRGNKISVTDPNGLVTSYTESSDGARSTVVHDPSGIKLQTRTVRNGDGRVYVQAVGVKGGDDTEQQVTRYVYDSKGRLAYEISAAGEITGYVYNTANQVTQTTRYGTRSPILIEATANHDEKWWSQVWDHEFYDHNIAELLLERDKTLDVVERTIYDKDGRVYAQINGIGAVTVFAQHDAQGRVTEKISYARIIIGKEHDSELDSVEKLQEKIASARGESRIDPSIDQHQRIIYDARGQVVAIVQAQKIVGEKLQWAVVSQEYDGNGNLTQKRHFEKRLSSSSDVTPPTDAEIAAFIARNNDDSAQPKLANDAITRHFYDAANRQKATLIAHSISAGTRNWSVSQNFFDKSGNIIRQTRNTELISEPIESKITLESHAAQSVFQYDNVKRLTLSAVLQNVNATGKGSWAVTKNTYDRAGNLERNIAYANTVNNLAPETDTATLLESMEKVASDSVRDRRNLFAYDRNNRLVLSMDANGAITRQVYSAVGDVVEKIAYATMAASHPSKLNTNYPVTSSAQDRRTNIIYDSQHRPVWEIDSLGHVSHRKYDALGREVRTARYAKPLDLQELARTNTDLKQLRVEDIQSIEPREGTIYLAPDKQDRVEHSFWNAAGHKTWHVDSGGFITSYDLDALGQVQNATHYSFQYHGKTQDNTNFNETVEADMTYVVRGELEASMSPYFTGVIRQDSYSYDAQGNVLNYRGQGNNQGSFTYDGRGLKRSYTNLLGNTWQYNYDAAGRLTQTTSPQVEIYSSSPSSDGVDGDWQAERAPSMRSVIERLAYDAFGNVITRTEAAGIPGQQRTTRYTYDKVGRQTTTSILASNVMHFNGQDIPVNGVATRSNLESPSGTLTTRVTYNTFGDAVQNKDILGNISSKIYDQRGQVSYEISASIAVNASPDTDANAIEQARYVTGYTRDTFGNVLSHKRYYQPLKQSSISDAQLLRASPERIASLLQDSSEDREIRTTYDQLNRATKIVEAATILYDTSSLTGSSLLTAARTTDNQYNRFGDLIVQSKYAADAEGKRLTAAATTHYYYDRRGLKIAQLQQINDSQAYLTGYEYDSNGNLLTQIEYSKAVSGWTDSSYGVTHSDANNDREVRYRYSENNQVVETTRINVLGMMFAYEDHHARRDVTTYSFYDAAGNLTYARDELNSITFTKYNALGHVVSVAKTGYHAEVTGEATEGNSDVALSTFKLDAFGNVLIRTDYANGAVSDAEGTPKLADPLRDRVTVNNYDALGRKIETIDAERHKTHFSYDRMGRLAAQWGSYSEVDSDGQLGAQKYTTFVRREYDALGRVVRVTTPPNQTVTNHFTQNKVVQTEYNAFDEVTGNKLLGTSTSQIDYAKYDHTGKIWLTNSSDGIDRITLYNAQGQESAQFRSIDSTTKSNGNYLSVVSALHGKANLVEALSTSNLVLSETRYDLLGHVVEKNRVVPNATLKVLQTKLDGSWEARPLTPSTPNKQLDKTALGARRLVMAEPSNDGSSGSTGNTYTVMLRHMGSRHWFNAAPHLETIDGYTLLNTTSLASGNYDFEVSGRSNEKELGVSASGSIKIDNHVTARQLVLLYNVLANRSPDHGGFNFWLGSANQGSSIATIAQQMLESAEVRGYLTKQGTDTSNEAIIKLIFNNALGRSGEATDSSYATDIAHWSARLNAVPASQHGAVISDLINDSLSVSPLQHREQARQRLENRRDVLMHYLVELHGSSRDQADALFLQAATDGKAAMEVAAQAGAPDLQRYQLSLLYSAILGRGIDATSLAAWQPILSSDRGDALAQVATLLLASPEAINNDVPQDAGSANYSKRLIEKIYRNLGLPAPSLADLARWQSSFLEKQADQQSARFFAGEFVVQLSREVSHYIGNDPAMLRAQQVLREAMTSSDTSVPSVSWIAQSVNQKVIATVRPGTDSMQLDRWGNVLAQRDQRNSTWRTEFSYNDRNQVVSKWSASALTVQTWNQNNTPILTEQRGKHTNLYDFTGNLIISTDENGNVNTFEYDAAGNLRKETRADGYAVYYTVDLFGQRVTATQELFRTADYSQNIATHFRYDRLGQQIDRVVNNVLVGVTDSGTMKVILEHGDTHNTITYDELGRRVSTGNYYTLSNGLGDGTHLAKSVQQRVKYDANGNVISNINEAGIETKFEYDQFGHKTLQVDALGATLTWKNDIAGRVIEQTDLNQRKTLNRYDGLGRVSTQTVTHSDGSALTQRSMQYDERNNVLIETASIAGGEQKIAHYSYDLANNRVWEYLRIAGGKVLQDQRMQYNERAWLVAVQSNIDRANYQLTYSYDLVGNRVALHNEYNIETRYHDGTNHLPYNDSANPLINRIDMRYDYDAMNRQSGIRRVTQLQTYIPKTPSDPNLPKTTSLETIENSSSTLTKEAFVGWQTVTQDFSERITFDALGNRRIYKRGESIEEYQYDAAGRLQHIILGGQERARRYYDAAGRVVESLHLKNADRELNTNLYVAGRLSRTHTTHTFTNSGNNLESDTYYDRYDAVGNLLEYRSTADNKHFTRYEMEYHLADRFDNYNESKTTVYAPPTVSGEPAPAPTTVTKKYNAFGYLLELRDEKTPQNNRSLLHDLQGRALQSASAEITEPMRYIDPKTYRLIDPIRYNLIVNGQTLGHSSLEGQSFSAGFDPISYSAPQNTPGSYSVQNEGETLRSIATAIWGDGRLWYILADANGMSFDTGLKTGTVLTVPTRTAATHSDYQTYKPYSLESFMGPKHEIPLQEPSKESYLCGRGMEQFISIVVSVTVTFFTGIPALGNLAGQGVRIINGTQDGIDWKSLNSLRVTNVVDMLLNYAGVFPGSDLASVAARSVVSNVVSQGVSVAIGIQDRFDWRGAALAGAMPYVNDFVSDGLSKSGMFGGVLNDRNGFGNRLLTGMVSSATVALARGGRVRGVEIFTDAFGNLLGQSLGQSMRNSMDKRHATADDEAQLQHDEDMRDAAMAQALGGNPSSRNAPSYSTTPLDFFTAASPSFTEDQLDNQRQRTVADLYVETYGGEVHDARYLSRRETDAIQKNVNNFLKFQDRTTGRTYAEIIGENLVLDGRIGRRDSPFNDGRDREIFDSTVYSSASGLLLMAATYNVDAGQRSQISDSLGTFNGGFTNEYLGAKSFLAGLGNSLGKSFTEDGITALYFNSYNGDDKKPLFAGNYNSNPSYRIAYDSLFGVGESLSTRLRAAGPGLAIMAASLSVGYGAPKINAGLNNYVSKTGNWVPTEQIPDIERVRGTYVAKGGQTGGANSIEAAASPFVTSPTRVAVRELKDFGLNSAQRRSFFEGKQVLFEDPSTSFETATIFKLSPGTLHAGVYDMISDGSGAVLSFANRSRSLGNSLGVKNLELFGADIQNPQLQSLMIRRGFEPGPPVRIDAFGFDKYVETLRKTEVLRK